MASLRLALKASMEASLEKPAPGSSKIQKPSKGDQHSSVGRGPRQLPQSAGASTALAELALYKAQRKNSRLSETQSVASDESGKASIQSSAPSSKKHSDNDTTPVRAPVTKKRNFDSVKPLNVFESPAKKSTAFHSTPANIDRVTESTVEVIENTKLQIDMSAFKNQNNDVGAFNNQNNDVGSNYTPTAEPSDTKNMTKDKEETYKVGDVHSSEDRLDKDEARARHSDTEKEVWKNAVGNVEGEGDKTIGSNHVIVGEESTPRHKRAAAVMAKTKLNTRKHLDEKELEKEALHAGITIGVEADGDDDENGFDEAGNRRGNKTAKKATARLSGGKTQRREPIEVVAPAEEDKFACCDLCEKWRKLPQHVDTATLPEQWNCSMNVWDGLRNTCEAPEESFEASKAPLEEAEEEIDNNKVKSQSRRGGGKRRRNEAGDDEDDILDADGKRKPHKQRASLDGKSPRTEPGTPLVPEQWVQCDKCTKWRKVAADVDPEELPTVWYCSMNTWNPQVARCGARQEKSQEKSSAGEDFVPPGGRGKYIRKPNNDRAEQLMTPTATPNAPPLIPGMPVKKVTQWVQCERKNCQKWRKVGAQIDMELLPEKWFCEMNTWDYDRATCDAPEEDASDTEGAGTSGISTQLIVGNSKGANALSYRRLIFSQDGRLRPIYSEKNKYGHGIFSHSEVHAANEIDEYIAPTRSVGYWWSSLYDDSLGACYSTGSKRHPAVNDPGAKKIKDAAKDPDEAKQHEFDVVDGVTVVSKREQWPPSIAQHSLPLSGDVVKGSYHIVTAFRRMHRMQCPFEARYVDAILAKSVARKSRMSIQDILRVETSVVKSCIVGACRESDISCQPTTATDGSGNIAISSIWSTIQSARFFTANEEACRACMTLSSLKTVIKRLEDADYLRVVFSGDGELCIYLLSTLSSVIQSRKSKRLAREFIASENKTPLAKTNHMLSSDVDMDPLIGTAYYWPHCGERERIIPTVEMEPEHTNFAAEREPVEIGSVDISENTIAPVVDEASASGAPVKKQSYVFGAARPPLKLRKYLKAEYCTTKTEK